MSQQLSFSTKPLRGTNKPFFLSTIYASLDRRQRLQLWDSLKHFLASHVTTFDPWLLIGDFNSILAPQDKLGGRWDTRHPGHCNFHEFMDSTNINDMGFVGLPYTWSNNRRPPHRILKRLDRSLCNEPWSRIYGEYALHHFPWIGSDHCPLQYQQQAFRFENMWLLHPGFHAVVEQAWQHTNSCSSLFTAKLTTVQRELQIWKKETFGSFTFALRRLKKHIEGIQHSLAYQKS